MNRVVVGLSKMEKPSRIFKEGLSGEAYGVYVKAEPGKKYMIGESIPAIVIIETFETVDGRKQRVLRNVTLRAEKGKTIIINENSRYLIGCFWGSEIEIGEENYLFNCYIQQY